MPSSPTASVIFQSTSIQGSYLTVWVATGGTKPPSPYTIGTASNPVPLGAVLAGGKLAAAYSETISAQSGSSPYTFAVTAGSLPTGLSLNSSTGAISGTPTTTGTFTFTITVTDTNSHTGSQGFTINVTSGSGSGNCGFVF